MTAAQLLEEVSADLKRAMERQVKRCETLRREAGLNDWRCQQAIGAQYALREARARLNRKFGKAVRP